MTMAAPIETHANIHHSLVTVSSEKSERIYTTHQEHAA